MRVLLASHTAPGGVFTVGSHHLARELSARVTMSATSRRRSPSCTSSAVNDPGVEVARAMDWSGRARRLGTFLEELRSPAAATARDDVRPRGGR